MNANHPALQRALLAYGAGAILAGAATWLAGYGDPWPLLGTSSGALFMAGALRLLARAAAMNAHSSDERELRRMVLRFGALAGASGAVVFMLALARWQLLPVPTQMLWIAAAFAATSLAMAWRAVRRLAVFLEPQDDEQREDDENGAKGGG